MAWYTSPKRGTMKEEEEEEAAPSPSPSPSLPHTHTHTFSPSPSPSLSPSSSDTTTHFATPASSPPPHFSSQSKAKHGSADPPHPSSSTRQPRSGSTSQTNLLSSRIASYEARAASARDKASGVTGKRRASVASTLTPLRGYYDAATKKFPAPPCGAGAGGGVDYSVERSGSPGVNRGWRMDVGVRGLEEAVDEEEEEGLSSGIPPVFPPGSLLSTRRDTSRLLHWKKEGLAADGASVKPSGSWLGTPDAKEEEEARVYWDGVLAHVNEAGDNALWGKKEVLGYPADNIEYHRCKMPARDEHSEPTEFSERKADRDQVLQVYHNSSYPKHKLEGVFFDDTEILNEDRRRRAICVDEPDDDPSLQPTCDTCEYVKLPLHERLRNRLPSPSVFTPLTYRSKYHSLQSVEMASMTKDLPLKDDTLKARGMQYDENRRVLEEALEQDRIMTETPHDVDALRCHFGHSLKASEHVSCRHPVAGTISDIDTLQYLLLGQHELRRDIERLQCVEHAVQTSISRLDILPVTYRGCVFPKRTLEDELEKARLREEAEMCDAAADELNPIENEQLHAVDNIEPAVGSSFKPLGGNIATANLAVGESFPFADQPRQRQLITPRSPSVYSDSTARAQSTTSIPRALPELPGTRTGRDTQRSPKPLEQDRAAAHRIMQSIRTFHNRGRTRQASSVGVSVTSESGRTGRREERGRREDAVVTSPSRQDEERYPRRQNIVQQ